MTMARLQYIRIFLLRKLLRELENRERKKKFKLIRAAFYSADLCLLFIGVILMFHIKLYKWRCYLKKKIQKKYAIE